jgi:hypothetical protein
MQHKSCQSCPENNVRILPHGCGVAYQGGEERTLVRVVIYQDRPQGTAFTAACVLCRCLDAQECIQLLLVALLALSALVVFAYSLRRGRALCRAQMELRSLHTKVLLLSKAGRPCGYNMKQHKLR